MDSVRIPIDQQGRDIPWASALPKVCPRTLARKSHSRTRCPVDLLVCVALGVDMVNHIHDIVEAGLDVCCIGRLCLPYAHRAIWRGADLQRASQST